jgi:hypothetical protein
MAVKKAVAVKKAEVAKKADSPNSDLKLWCERCCIRIAPNEERTVSRGKTYHLQCYSKAFPSRPQTEILKSRLP